MSAHAALVPLAATLIAAAGCTAVTNFDLRRAAETTDALCADAIDNDGDGLTDCQDWKCLDRPVCCNMPIVVLADDFEPGPCAQASCTSPDPACVVDPTRWQSWGLPIPALCQGGLNPRKAEQCYDVGVLARQPLLLHPGLAVTAKVRGIPELAGRLEVGLTLQETISGGSTRCSPVEGVDPVVSLRAVGSADGVQWVATFDRAEIGRSRVITGGVCHDVRLAIDANRRVHYAVGGEDFAVSAVDQPLPSTALTARLALAGRGLSASFEEVRIVDGTQCDDPRAWVPATPFVALDTNERPRSWDSYRVTHPAVWQAPGGTLLLYYTGCAETPLGGDCSLALGIGRAFSEDALTFTRDPTQRLKPTSHPDMDIAFLASTGPGDNRLHGYQATNSQATVPDQAIFPFVEVDFGQPDQPDNFDNFRGGLRPVLNPGASGNWDDDKVCCSTVLEQGAVQRLWYAGKSMSDPTWRIGLATSTDGGLTFTRAPENPLLREGPRESFDEKGMRDPQVLYDPQRRLYRMWYTAQAFLGVTSIGYAISVDGVHWHKFPGNPALDRIGLGLDTIGSPAVLSQEGVIRMWVNGSESGKSGVRIYGLENRGRPQR